MTNWQFADGMRRVMRGAPEIELGSSDRIVIMSDFHMGDGSSRDDLKRNGELLLTALERHYLARGSVLVLNGDIEDVQKFPLPKIRSAWRPMYSILDRFSREGRLYKILGNHDDALLESSRYPYPLHQGVKLRWEGRELDVFHGHQASGLYLKHNDMSGAVIRYVFHTLHIHNVSASGDSRRKYRVEKKIYAFSREAGLVSVIGHTHRPLFESLSKYDRLRFEIERLCSEYGEAGEDRKAEIAEIVGLYKEEILAMNRRDRRRGRVPGLYERDILLPCLFNSGSAIGKRGVTAIEIEEGRIALAYWFEEGTERRYLSRASAPAKKLEDSPYYRASIASESLAGVFARMDLLA
jgi:Calcineurin-like phosphoesterase.